MTPRFFDTIRRAYARYPVLFHTAGWLTFIFLPDPFVSFPQIFNRDEGLIIYSIKLVNNVAGLLFFYLNLYVITPYLLRRNKLYWLAPVGLVLVLLLLLLNRFNFQSFITDSDQNLAEKIARLEQSLLRREHMLGVPLPLAITSTLLLIFLMTLSSGIVIYQDRNRQQAAHQQMMIEKKEAELSALKLQISPHFLFNTLNNMRWLARQKSDKTEDAIQRLSDMLRYMIYQADKGPVPLAKEIDYLTDYIELQRLRLSPHNQIVFDHDVPNAQVRIEPLLLIHFVENAVKHGIHHDQPSMITIQLRVERNVLSFSTRNPLYQTAKAGPSGDSGIGSQNVERRLALHYPGRHDLRIRTENGLFCVDLTIQLP